MGYLGFATGCHPGIHIIATHDQLQGEFHVTKNQMTVVTSTIAAISAVLVAGLGWLGTRPPPAADATVDEAPAIDCRRASQSDGEQTTIAFVNQSEETVQLSWVDTSGIEIPYEALAPGQRTSRETIVGHSWCVRDRNTRVAVAFAIASEDEQVVVIQ